MPTQTPIDLFKKTNRKLTVGCIYLGERKAPALRLSGNWLLEAGFEINRKVSVQASRGQILIQLIGEGTPCK